MPRWEYRKMDLNELPRRTEDVDLLNMAGEQGWGLVAIATNGIAYFKRQVEDPQRAPAARRKVAS